MMKARDPDGQRMTMILVVVLGSLCILLAIIGAVAV